MNKNLLSTIESKNVLAGSIFTINSTTESGITSAYTGGYLERRISSPVDGLN